MAGKPKTNYTSESNKFITSISQKQDRQRLAITQSNTQLRATVTSGKL